MPTHAPPTSEESAAIYAEAKNLAVRIKTKHGDIVFEFFPDDAPSTVAAIVKLARAGFYDGLKFHRVEPGFVIQGGCPRGDGTGDAGYKLKAEFNDRPHVLGTVAMARAASPNSAGSQFYICLGDAKFLDKQYTVFGRVTQGIDAVKAIQVGDVMETVVVESKA
jgi:cyclophilin family peptidyl-prolyl cis-trans isomerase